MRDGAHGEACALAMRILLRSAALLGADSLIDIGSAHIDGCLYHGPVSLDFVDRLVAGGGRVRVPTTLNVGSIDLIHPELFRGTDRLRDDGRRLMEAHLALGCEASFTCAPYQLKHRPQLGDQIAWAESNAIVFANSVLGARTNRYGDFIDLCAALTGRAPNCGLHLTANRAATVLFDVSDFPQAPAERDVFFALLGFVVGRQTGDDLPAIAGLPADTTEDELKALGAAAASTGAVAMFHAIGLTPEAATLDLAFQGFAPARTVPVARADLDAARERINQGRAGAGLAAVSVGTPHFSITEFAALRRLLDADARPLRVPFYVNTSRFVVWQLEEAGLLRGLQAHGLTIVNDTCTYITPILGEMTGVVMTNSGKWAHYAPANIGVEVAFGTLAECVRSARAGEVVFVGA